MHRRDLLKAVAATPLAGVVSRNIACAWVIVPPRSHVRPGDPGWPSPAQWDELKQSVGGRLLQPASPFANCRVLPAGPSCADAVKQIGNPYYIGDQPGLAQSSGWADAWLSRPSAYAVAAAHTADVVAAINFARRHNLRLVVKGGGHSYQGCSGAPDSLLVWTRHMNDITLHDAFVAHGCGGKHGPQPAVTVGAGAMWVDAYDAVTTRGGRYVQGGGCTTVGVAGLVQSGGFGSFSKQFGTAAAGLLEAEVVTADGKVRIANGCTNPDLFWAIKGGGGGSLGVVTRLTLRTRELPEFFGGVFGEIKAASDAAYRTLISRILAFYRDALFNPHWGEQLVFATNNTLRLSMVFQGLTQTQAQAIWQPFIDWVNQSKADYSVSRPMQIIALPARHFWDATFLQQLGPGLVGIDDRPGASPHHFFWAGDQAQTGQFLHGYKSAWLPAALLRDDRQASLVDACFAATRHWEFALHCNKGLAGAPADEVGAARDTATNPEVLDAFALAIIAGSGPPAYPGLPGKPDLIAARHDAARIAQAMDALLRAAPGVGSYLSESDYFQRDWQHAFWGTNYDRLAAVKQEYDPAGLFVVHHGVGSEAWSDDGFTRR